MVLGRRGHIVEVGEDWSEGRLTAAARDGKVLKAAANPRGMQGGEVGWKGRAASVVERVGDVQAV